MDPLIVLQNRIEQLEAKLGLGSAPADGQRGDSAVEQLASAADAMQSATAGHDKLAAAAQRATELNNYADPNFVEKVQENDMHMREVAAAEPVIKHHCHCMHRCKQAEPVLESEVLTEVPNMEATVNNMQAAAAEVMQESDNISHGVAELAETCGAAACNASEELANIAQKVEQVEIKRCPPRRNGLD